MTAPAMTPTRDRPGADRAKRKRLGWARGVAMVAACASCTAAAAAGTPSAVRRLPGPEVVGPFSGRLTPARSTATFPILAKRPSILTWVYKGPAVRFLVTLPGGDVDGPGITPPYALARPGRYTVAISSNTMAEGIYGPYRMTFRLRPSP